MNASEARTLTHTPPPQRHVDDCLARIMDWIDAAARRGMNRIRLTENDMGKSGLVGPKITSAVLTAIEAKGYMVSHQRDVIQGIGGGIVPVRPHKGNAIDISW